MLGLLDPGTALPPAGSSPICHRPAWVSGQESPEADGVESERRNLQLVVGVGGGGMKYLRGVVLPAYTNGFSGSINTVKLWAPWV